MVGKSHNSQKGMAKASRHVRELETLYKIMVSCMKKNPVTIIVRRIKPRRTLGLTNQFNSLSIISV